MALSRNKLYTLLLLSCMVGGLWLWFGILHDTNQANPIGVCMIKHATGLPCPSCGSTRAIVLLSKGLWMDALVTNPFGYMIAFIMLLAPLWILFDIGTKRKTLFQFYKIIESRLKNPGLSIPLAVLVLINWIWNITKGL